MHTACVWSEKLPFAEYSVVKDPPSPCGLRRDKPATVVADLPKNLAWTSRPAFALALAGLPSRSLAQCDSYGEAEAGGEYRARTGDLLVANQALSQLS
jgi:hypothetical protein